MWTVLRQRDFALLWFGGLVSVIGDWMLLIVLPFYVYARTGSALASGATWIAATLPSVLLGSVAGVFVDRWDRKRIMVVVSFCQAAVLLGLLAVRSAEWFGLIYLVTFIQSALFRFFGPAESALLPRLVGEEQLTAANSLNSLNDNLGRLLGPALGGVLLATAGLPSVVIIDIVSFLTAGVLIACIAVPPAVSDERVPDTQAAVATRMAVWRDWLDGLRPIRQERILLSLFSITATGVFGDSIATALTVPYFTDVVGGDAGAYGWLQTARGIGGIVGGVVVGLAARRYAPTRLLALGMGGVGLIGLVRYNIPVLWVYLVCNVLAGVVVMGWLITSPTLLQRNVADRYRGRVFGAYGATTSLLMLAGVGLAGALGERVGIVSLLNVSSGLYILAGVLAAILLRGASGRPIVSTPSPTTEERPAPMVPPAR